MSDRPRFHLAFPVHDLAEARRFYGEILGCPEGRSSADWVDFDLHGHQIVAHLAPEATEPSAHHLAARVIFLAQKLQSAPTSE